VRHHRLVADALDGLDLPVPVSTLGMKPVGTIRKRYTVPTSSSADTIIVAPLKRIDCWRVQAYPRNQESNTFSMAL
jgi:hypothetical protein